MTARVFISGIAGFLGGNLAAYYREAGCTVSGVDNLLGGDVANVPDGVDFRLTGCADVATCKDMIRAGDLVIHCAAAPYEGLSVFSPVVVYEHTLQSTVALLAAAISSGARRFVFCSSMARYGAGPTPFTEDQPADPVDPYGWAKLSAEHAVANLCDIHGVSWTIAVPHNVYGERQRFDDPYRNVIAIMINRMCQGKQPIIYGDGSQRRCFSYVGDVVEPLARMGELPAAHGQVVNIGPDGQDLSILELATILADLMNVELDPIFLPPRPREVPVAHCSSDKARTVLGYTSRWQLKDGLRRMVDHVAAAGPRPFRYHLPVEIPTGQTPLTWTERLL